MKIATWMPGGGTSAGAEPGGTGGTGGTGFGGEQATPTTGFVVGDQLYAAPDGTDVLALTRAGLVAALAIGERAVATVTPVSLASVRLLPPLVPPSIRDFVAFEEHVEGVVKSVSGEAEVGAEWYEAPTFYFTNPHTVRATGDDISAPSGSTALDLETEVAAVIGAVAGSDGSNLGPADAHRHLFGYTILNDWSARDLQRREMRVNLGPCKGKDFASTLGPWIVTADEFENLHDDDGFLPLGMSATINGVELGRDLLSNMGWPFAELVSYASRNSRVVPGDVLGSGTCGGGCLAELWGRNGSQTPPPLQIGDVVRLTVEGIGWVENRIVPGLQLPPVSAARVRPRNRVRADA
ncbi:MAG: 2-keto-4-pentenoate hydratase/2-oxohepta-3-ene,7-dioic acid hydratase [Subtercola sp.]|nr:2-keto-4-pentenoate hydratase/2-oxohepta-3-ene,7-dioic acid hydratase [Subtercola sp.]